MSATYDTSRSYEDNYATGPVFTGELPDLDRLNTGLPQARFLGFPVNSTLGVPAGPLLNSAYIRLYADLGFDVLTYKTVRTAAHASHPFPNVRPVETAPGWYVTSNSEKPALHTLPAEPIVTELSITNSFGMPSQPPAVWQADVARARAALHPGQVLVVSVVGTALAGGSLTDLANDFGRAAQLAAQAGADIIEANLSCPNVQSGEGSLYSSPAAVGQVAAALKTALGQTPFLLKIGYMTDMNLIRQVVETAQQNGAAGLAAINTIPARVYVETGEQALPGAGRLVSGICGAGIKEAGLLMADRLLAARRELRLSDFAIVGVGGVMTGLDALEYLRKGVDGVQSGTGAMWQPGLAAEFKQALKTSLVAQV